jgi:MoaA/NifB/PqqE/SkfB family radical SAM enzyme
MKDSFVADALKALRALAMRKISLTFDSIPHEMENVPLRKIINWILVEASVYVKPARPWGRPTHIVIEPSSLCDLKCPHCPTSLGMDRPRGNMSFELYKKVLDEAGDHLLQVILWNWGEPFMNPALFDMITYARKKGIWVVTSTNGQTLSKRGVADRIISSGLETLIVAVDGATQEAYSRFRRGGALDAVLDGVRILAERKRAVGSLTPLINLRYVVTRNNESEVGMIKELAPSLGADLLTVRSSLNVYDEGVLDDGLSPANARLRRFERDKDGRRIRLKKNPCKRLWNNPAVHSNGNVCVCFMDWDEKSVLGDVNRDTILDVWRGEKYRALRRTFRRNYEEIDNACGDRVAPCAGRLQGDRVDNGSVW